MNLLTLMHSNLDAAPGLAAVLMAGGIILGALFLRGFFAWYLKIDRCLKLLQSIHSELKILNQARRIQTPIMPMAANGHATKSLRMEPVAAVAQEPKIELSPLSTAKPAPVRYSSPEPIVEAEPAMPVEKQKIEEPVVAVNPEPVIEKSAPAYEPRRMGAIEFIPERGARKIASEKPKVEDAIVIKTEPMKREEIKKEVPKRVFPQPEAVADEETIDEPEAKSSRARKLILEDDARRSPSPLPPL